MLSNKMLDLILEELGLEEDEEFKTETEIKSIGVNNIINASLYKVNRTGLQVKSIHFDDWTHSIRLDDLLLGKLKIFKLPFVPELNEAYYVPDISIVDLYFKTLNYNTKDDKHRIEREICFRTKEGAINRTKEVLGSLRGGTDE